MSKSEMTAHDPAPMPARSPTAQAQGLPLDEAGLSPSHIEAIAALLGLSEAELWHALEPEGDQGLNEGAACIPLEAIARLLRSFVSIKDALLRDRIVTMVESLAAG